MKKYSIHENSAAMTADEQVMELMRTVKCRLGRSEVVPVL